MTIVARMLTQEHDGIGGYMAHPEGVGQRLGVLMAHHAYGVTADYTIDAYRLAALGFNVLATVMIVLPFAGRRGVARRRRPRPS